MTSKFSIDNRELLQRISSGEAVVGIDFGNLIVRELAAFRLAAMDSEPVAEITEDLGRLFVKIHHPTTLKAGDKLYRHAQPAHITENIERDAQRYRFLREKDAFGDDGEPGLASWDDLIELDTNEFDAAIDARMAHPSVDFLALDNALQKHERRRCKDRNCNKPIYGYSVDGLCEDCYTAISQQPAPVVPELRVDWQENEFSAGWNACRAAMLNGGKS
ncbi:TPA: hypothetical protein ACPT59_003691 [Klebsiella pneumoniae]